MRIRTQTNMASVAVTNHFTNSQTNSVSSARLTTTPMTSSRLTSRSDTLEIIIVDDDIHHTVKTLLEVHRNKPSEELVKAIGKTVQAERNHWKHRLNTAMQEIDRQHKVILQNQSTVQELLAILSAEPSKNSKQEETLEAETSEDVPSTKNLLEDLKRKIKHLKQLAGVTDGILMKDPKDRVAKYSDLDLKYLKNAISQLHWEKDSLQSKVDEQDKEIMWLKGEMKNTKGHLTKLQDIVTSYNVCHMGGGFHLENMSEEMEDLSDKVSPHQSKLSPSSKPTPRMRERKYIEGDQIVSYPVGKDEVAFWKTRLRANVYSNKGGNSRTGVAQCLRCNRLFKPSNNSNRACIFHSKGREIKEIYDENGKILNVQYKWACCRRGLESVGCNHGFHI